MRSTRDKGLRFSLVVPVFNEAANIGAFCDAALGMSSWPHEVLVCYDRPDDDTLPALERLPIDRRPTKLRLVHNTLGPGVRYAIEAGMRAARAPVVVVTMADLSDDLADVERLVERVEAGAAVVCGSRYVQGGRQLGGPRLKSWMSRAAGLSLHALAGLPVHDPTNSFKAYSAAFLNEVQIESQEGFVLGFELTLKAHFGGRRVEQVPTTWRDRTAGESRFQLRRWVPRYLQWYLWALRQARGGPRGQPAQSR